jgi:hypothetical protein
MTRARKFSLIVLLSLTGFVLLNLTIWKLWNEDLATAVRSDGGDLARMGYLTGSTIHRRVTCDLPLRHIEKKNYRGEPVRIVTFGDSFSNGEGGGKNPYYQDYIATVNGCGVLNIPPYSNLDFLTQVAIYCNNGLLDWVKPKYLILSSAERFCVSRFSGDWNRWLRAPERELRKYPKTGFHSKPPASSDPFAFINEGNLKFLLYQALYPFSDHAFFSRTYVGHLSRPLFSCEKGDRLLFYRDDLLGAPLATPEKMRRLNDNLNALADMLSKKGIRLVFMPCVDKYDLYGDYLVGNRHPRSRFFEELRSLPKKYDVIDSKAILAEEVSRGEKDIFYPDDTHWSWKGHEKIFRTVKFP